MIDFEWTIYSSLKLHASLEFINVLLSLVLTGLMFDRYRLNGRSFVILIWILGLIGMTITNLFHAVHVYEMSYSSNIFKGIHKCYSGYAILVTALLAGSIRYTFNYRNTTKNILVIVVSFTFIQLLFYITHESYEYLLFGYCLIVGTVSYLLYTFNTQLSIITPYKLNLIILVYLCAVFIMWVSNGHDYLLILSVVMKMSILIAGIYFIFHEVEEITKSDIGKLIRNRSEHYGVEIEKLSEFLDQFQDKRKSGNG